VKDCRTVREALVASGLAFAYLSLGSSSAHFWLDSGELAAAGWDLGVQHPPGFPGLVLLLRAATLVPLGSLGFRMALLSAALGSIAVGLVVAILRRRDVSLPVAAGGAAWIVSGLTFVRQARVVEVYALTAALLLLALWGLDPKVPGPKRTGRRLVGVGAAVWAAWCFGDLRLALVPLCILVWWRGRAAGRAWTRWAPVVVVLASLVVLAIPLASVSGPTFDWGNPETFASLWDHVAARSIREAYADEILPASPALWGLHAVDALQRLAEDLGAPGLVAFAVALARAWWIGPRSEAAAISWIVLVELVFAIGINPMGGADRQTGLVLGPIAALVVGVEIHAALADRPWGRMLLLPLMGTVLVLPAAIQSASDAAITRSWGPHAWTRGVLAQLPPRSLLLVQSDDLASGLAAARALEGARPDIVALPAQHLYKGGSEAALADPREAIVWRSAAAASTERDRIVAAIEAFPGPIALEHPATTVFANVPFLPPHGDLPLRMNAAAAPVTPVPDLVQHWLARLPTREDRRRLGVALAELARATVRVEGDLPRATALLQLSLSQVDPAHPAALVTLAALRHRQGDTADAIALTREALALDPGRSVALGNLALYLSETPAGIDEALALAERAAALRPWRADVWARLAQVRERAGDPDGAFDARARAAAASDAPDPADREPQGGAGVPDP
jgi:tetratricopeptide (TPR) repeat protein